MRTTSVVAQVFSHMFFLTAEDGPEGRSGTSASHRFRILIVEDEWLIASTIKMALAERGYEIVGVAVSADEAVHAAMAGQPDLVLMDVQLLGTRDGVDAAIEIREKVDLPCLFVTAFGNASVQERAAPARPAGWLRKPFTDEQLLAAVAAALT